MIFGPGARRQVVYDLLRRDPLHQADAYVTPRLIMTQSGSSLFSFRGASGSACIWKVTWARCTDAVPKAGDVTVTRAGISCPTGLSLFVLTLSCFNVLIPRFLVAGQSVVSRRLKTPPIDNWGGSAEPSFGRLVRRRLIFTANAVSKCRKARPEPKSRVRRFRMRAVHGRGAQLVEQETENLCFGGSSVPGPSPQIPADYTPLDVVYRTRHILPYFP